MKRILITYIILLAILTSGWSQSFTIKTDRDSILIGEPISVELTLQKESIKDIFWPNFQVGDSLGDSFEITEVFDKDTLVKNTTILSQQLTITSFALGLKTLQPLVLYSEEELITSNAIKIQVNLLPADTTQPIRDIKPIREANITFKDRWGMFLIWAKANWYYMLLILAVFIFLIWFLFIRKKKEEVKEIIEKSKPVIPAHVVAFDSLKQLDEEQLWQQGNQKEFNFRLTNIVRAYISDRFKVNATGKTTNEILQEGKVIIGSENRDKLRKLLMLSDLVKFAKEQPTEEENKAVMNDTINFVETTKVDN